MTMYLYTKSKEYAVYRDRMYGVGYVECLADKRETPLFTGIEGWQDLTNLARAKRKAGVRVFNSLCARHFAPGVTVYDDAGNMRHI